MFGFSEFERVLEYGQPRPPALRLVSRNNREPVDVKISSHGRLNVAALRTHIADGGTVVINGVQDYAPGVAELVEHLQGSLGARVTANAYLTPANSQGFKAHYDNHDVLVAQTEGSKEWHLYGETDAREPIDFDEGSVAPDGLSSPSVLRLVSGDLLYVPRGWVHGAEALEEPSLHITLGIHPFSIADALHVLVDLAAGRVPELSSSLPLGVLSSAASSASEETWELVRRSLASLGDSGDMSAAIDFLQGQLVRASRLGTRGGLVSDIHGLSTLSQDSRLEVATPLFARVVKSAGGVALHCSESVVQAPSVFEPAMRYVLNVHGSFHVRDLPMLADRERLALCYALVRDGMLRLSTSPKPKMKVATRVDRPQGVEALGG